jgi:drug/metabolite transporter (DMT)-like permease
MAKLVVISVAVQLLGNGLFQWSLGILGLALAIPLTLGGVLVGSAVIGQLLLGERVSNSNIFSILILMVAVVVLSLGAADASDAMQSQLDTGPRSPLVVIVGVLGICFAGVAFSALGAVIRQVAQAGMPLSTILVTNGVVGVIVLCGIALANNPELATSTELIDWNSMLGAGLFNAVAFCALTGALKHTRLLYVNALNVTQLAMAAVAGIVLFSEPTSPQLLIGVVLTGMGILVMGRTR